MLFSISLWKKGSGEILIFTSLLWIKRGFSPLIIIPPQPGATSWTFCATSAVIPPLITHYNNETMWEYWCLLIPKSWQSCASEHTAALAASTDLCRVEEEVLCMGLEICMVLELTGDSVDDNEVIIEWTLWGWLSREDAEAEAQENGGTGKSMVPIKNQERVVLAALLKKPTKGRTKHHPLPRGGFRYHLNDSVLCVQHPGRE